MTRPSKTLPPSDYPELHPSPGPPRRPCAGCGTPPEGFMRIVELYTVAPPTAAQWWRCPFCATLLGTLLNLIFGVHSAETKE